MTPPILALAALLLMPAPVCAPAPAPVPPAAPVPPPHDTDLDRWPSLAVAEAQCAFARGYLTHARDMANGPGTEYAREWWTLAALEAYELWDAWDDLRLWHVYDGYGSKDRFRKHLTPAAWISGDMPPAAPFWRFKRVN